MMPDLDSKLLPDLLVFFEVARVGSISEAARRLHMVQTNVTVRVQKLEDALGVRLLDRGARVQHLNECNGAARRDRELKPSVFCAAPFQQRR